MKKFLSLIFLSILSLSFALANEVDYQISGTSGWTKTPYSAIKGKKIVIAAEGQVSHSWISGYHGPAGNSSAFCRDCRLSTKCNVGGLVMRIGNSKIYCVDPLISGNAPASGSIYFAINDMPLNDNKGSFKIKMIGPGITLGGSKF